jgi:hypothetical protein
MDKKKVFYLLVALLLVGTIVVWAAQAQEPSKAVPAKEAKAKKVAGTIDSFTETNLVLTHGMAGMKKQATFVLTPETKKEGTLKAGAKATVEYLVKGKEKVAMCVIVHKPKPKPAPETEKPKPKT